MPDDMSAIERIAEALRPLPEVDGAARARLLVAVQADAEHRARRAARRRLVTRAALAGALAASVVAVAIGVATTRRGGTPAATSPAAIVASRAAPSVPIARSVTPAADVGAAASVAVPLVLSAPLATHVSVVGDFTGWDQHRVRMTRDPASGLWVASVTVRPGRHVYAFVADDSIWLLDPRAPEASDPDFGRPGSLLLVGRP